MLTREEELAALVRDKRAADATYRKIKLGVEGPPPKKLAPKKKDDEEEKKDDKKKNGKAANNDKEVDAVVTTTDKPFKPTCTKKQLVRIKIKVIQGIHDTTNTDLTHLDLLPNDNVCTSFMMYRSKRRKINELPTRRTSGD